MLHAYKLLVFYAALVLALFDIHALVQRFFLPAPDPVAWGKVALAALLQATAFAVAWIYLLYLALDLRLLPLIAVGVILAYSVTVLFNAVNCGNHPLPANKGAPLCPP